MTNRVFVSMEDGIEEPAWFEKIEGFVLKVMEILQYDRQEISILFCSDIFIQNLNLEYRQIDSATDVLSFENGELYEEDGEEWFAAGDIAISVETLPKNSEYFEVTQNEELKRLLIHGLLHLNGFDHGEEHVEKGVEPVCEMLKLQKKIMDQLQSEILIG